MSMHFAWCHRRQLSHCIPRWFLLTGFWHFPQGNRIGPAFSDTSPLIKRNKIIRYLFGLWIGLQCTVFAFCPLFTCVAPWGLTIKFKIYSYWRWIWSLDGNKDHSSSGNELWSGKDSSWQVTSFSLRFTFHYFTIKNNFPLAKR